jgi:hypothetical protein
VDGVRDPWKLQYSPQRASGGVYSLEVDEEMKSRLEMKSPLFGTCYAYASAIPRSLHDQHSIVLGFHGYAATSRVSDYGGRSRGRTNIRDASGACVCYSLLVPNPARMQIPLLAPGPSLCHMWLGPLLVEIGPEGWTPTQQPPELSPSLRLLPLGYCLYLCEERKRLS